MPKMKQMVKRTEVEIAKARRTCKFSKVPILKGETCLMLFESSRDRFCYSQGTGLHMVKLARERLDELERQLSS